MSNIKKNIIIIRSGSASSDPRIERAAEMLSENFNIVLLAWDKTGNHKREEERKHYKIIRKKAKRYYLKPFNRIVNFLSWIFFINKYLCVKKYDIVHCCDFDTYAPIFIINKIRKKSVVYDIFDFYTEMIYNTPVIIKKLVKSLDFYLMKKANLVIIADESRKKQIRADRLKNLISIYNSPPDYYNDFNEKLKNKIPERITLTYLGLIDNNKRDLVFIINALKKIKEVDFKIIGFGKDFENIKEISKGYENIIIKGKMPYIEALKEEYLSHIILSVYDPKIKNNIYASPNKVFEAMMLKKAILINQEIMPAQIVKNKNCGLVYKFGSESSFSDTLKELIQSKKQLSDFGEKGRKIYEEEYSFSKMKSILTKKYSKL